MTVKFIALAEYTSRTKTNSLNVLGIFDCMVTDEFPYRHAGFNLVLFMQGGIEEVGHHQMKVELKSPSGEVIYTLEGDLEVMKGAVDRSDVHIDFALPVIGLTVKEYGKHTVEAAVDGEFAGSGYFIVAKGENLFR